MNEISHGHRGEDVRDVQQRLLALGLPIDPSEIGLYGSSTEAAVRAFQQQRGLFVDGRVGPETWTELVDSGWSLGDRTLYLRYPGFRGDDVAELQRRLNALGFDAGRQDGIFGQRTDLAVREFQRNVGREPDGVLGPATLHDLLRVRPAGEGFPPVSRAVVREGEALRGMRASMSAARVAIDPGHGGDDLGEVGPGGLTEADASLALALDLVDELRGRGAEPLLLREGDANPGPSDRAALANSFGAEVLVSIHMNAGDPTAEGATCLYFGNQATFSPAGLRLAELVQEELCSRMGLTDGRTHPMMIAILRESQMPAVQVEPCFITNPKEEGLLGEEGFRRDLAIAMAKGLERFFGARSRPEPTAVG